MTADARVGGRTGATGAFGTGSHRAARRARDFGPFDAEDLDPAAVPAPGMVDFGSVRVPVPDGGTVTVEPTANGRLQAVHVTMPGGRLSVSALAAPKSSELWPELVAEIDTSLREGGARVRSFQGEWGRELHARTGAANSVFIGVDGARWMLYGVATGPATYAVELEAALRTMLKGSVVDRGRSPYPVRTVLPLVVPEHLAGAVEDAEVSEADQAAPLRPARPPRAGPGRPVPPSAAADATQALPVTPRVAAPARRRPVDPPRPVPPVEAPTPLWATSPGPVSAADLGRDPADDVSVDRPLNDVVTPTEWWPAIPAGPERDPWPASGGSVDGAAPATERWSAVNHIAGPDPWPASGGSVDGAVPATARWPAVNPIDDGAPTERWPVVPVRDDGYRPGSDAAGPDADEPGAGETLYAELRRSRASYAEPPASDRVPFEPLDSEPLDSEPLDSEPLDSEPLFAGLLEARRRPALEPRVQPVDEPRAQPAEPSGRRRAPEGPDRAGGRRRAPDGPPRPQPGSGRRRAPDAGPGELRRADDTLDLAALVRERPGRRRARYEPEAPEPRSGGRRRAPEPADDPPAEETTAPLPVVAPGRHGRGEADPDWANPHEPGSGPALAYLPTTPARNPGRHHRPGPG